MQIVNGLHSTSIINGIEGGGAAYHTMYIDAGAMVPCTTNGAKSGTHEYGTNDIDMDYMAFDSGATEERVQFKLVMPEAWDLGTIKMRFYWSSETGSSPGDAVVWAVKANSLTDSDPIDAALGNTQLVADGLLAANGGDIQISGATPYMTIGGTPTKQRMVVFEIWRDTSNVLDDMAFKAWLFGVVIQFHSTNIVAPW